MDADYIENQRDQLLSRREKRWSMNSQRLEEIVAELMKPISSARRYFDTDLAALLEEYLTEAGLRALDAGEDGDDADVVPPNYAELALLLQQSANIYSRKVDFLYQHVMDVSEALHANTLQAEQPAAPGPGPGAGPAASPAPGARGGRAAPRDTFARTASPWDGARFAREPGARRPHPTLPRFFMELEPRLGSDASWQALRDHAGELVGLLDDFQANMEQDPHSGMLVDDWFDLRTDAERQGPPAISMLELQAAIAAAAPPPLAPPGPLASPPSSPLRTSTPLPAQASPGASNASPGASNASPGASDASPGASDASPGASDASAEPDAADTSAELALATPVRRERKRRHSINKIDYILERVKLTISEDLRKELQETREFSIPTTWIRREVKKRMNHILCERRRLRELEPDPRAGKRRRTPAGEPGGCDSGADSAPGAGAEFAGWSAAEAAQAAARAKGGRAPEPDSDDDGFFEQSSVGDGCDTSRDDAPGGPAGPAGPAWAAWQAGVLGRAAAAEARGGLDVRALGRAVLRALPPGAPRPFAHVLRHAARADHEVSHVLLATLFLANAGSVRVLPGAPLSLGSFSLLSPGSCEQLSPGRSEQLSPGSCGQLSPGSCGQLSPGRCGQLSPGSCCAERRGLPPAVPRATPPALDEGGQYPGATGYE